MVSIEHSSHIPQLSGTAPALASARRVFGRLVAALAAMALIALGAIVAQPATQAQAATASCVRANPGSGPYAETICWLDWTDLNIAAANGGTVPMTFTLDGGSTITMNVSITGTPVKVWEVPTWAGAQFGVNPYQFAGKPNLALYSSSGSVKNDQTIRLTNIKAQYSNNQPMTDFSMVAADAETTYSGIANDEYLSYGSDKSLQLITPLAGACSGGFSGNNSTQVDCVSGTAGRPTSTPVLLAKSPTTMTAHMGEKLAAGSQGVAFGVVVSSASVSKNVATRYASTDSFTVTAKNAVGTTMGQASTNTADTVTAGPYLELGTFDGTTSFTFEESGDGETDLANYDKSWSCTATVTTQSGTSTTPITIAGPTDGTSVTVPASNNQAVACTVTNTAKPADLLITKTAQPQSGNAVGRPFTYQITATNQNGAPVDGVTITDDVPAGLTIGATTPSVNPSGQTVTWSDQSFKAGQTKTYTIEVTPTVARSYTNTVIADANQGCKTDGTAADCSDSTSTDVGTGNNLKVVKTLQSDPKPKPGDWVTYQITAQNTDGQPTQAQQVLTDNVPAALQNVSIVTQPVGATAALDDHTLTMTIPASTTTSPFVVITGQIKPTAQPGEVTNTATLPGGCDSTATPNNCSGSASFDVTGNPADIVVDKTGPASAQIGSTVSYTITASNTGDVATSKANTITDQIPPQIDPNSVTVSAEPASAPISYADGTVTWTIPAGMLPATSGPAYSATITGKVKPNATAGTMTNTATMPSGSDCTGACSDAVETELTNSTGGLTVTKTSNPASGVHEGQQVTYSFVVKNSGQGDLHDVTVTDEGALFSDNKVTCQTSGDATIATLKQGASETCTMKHTFTAAEIAAGGVAWHTAGLTNTASAAGLDANDVPVSSPQASTTTTFDVSVATTVTKDASAPAKLRAGDTIDYTISVAYEGDDSLTNVALVDPMFPDLADHCSPSIPGTINRGFTSTCTVSHVVTEQDIRDNWASGAIKNTATLTGNSTIWPSTSINTEGTKIVPIDKSVPTVAFSGAKVASQTSADPGDTVRYTVTAKNTGQLTATDVVVYDSFKGATPTPIDPSDCTWPTASGILKAGETVTCRYSYVVSSEDASQTIHNAASVSGDDGETPVGPTQVGTADVTVSSGTDLTATKTNDAGSNRVKPGQSFDYTITVTNDGQAVAKGVVLSDPLPKYVEFVSGVPAADWTYDKDANTLVSAPFDVPGGGGQVSRTFTVRVADDAPSEQAIRNIGVIQGMATPAECEQNQAKAGCAVDTKTLTVDDSDVTVSKSNDVPTSPKVVKPGQTFDYTVTATNSGSSTASNVVITDRLPKGLSFASANQPGWQPLSGDTATSKPLTVLGHDTASLTLSVKVDADAAPGAELLNVMTTGETPIAGCVTNPNQTGCGKDIEPPSVVDHSKVTITKVNDLGVDKPKVKPGDVFTYTITAINKGTSTAQQVTISDTLPAGLVFDSAQNSAWSLDPATNTATLKKPVDVPTGTTGLSWDLRVKVADDAQAGALRNVAVMDDQDPAACSLTNPSNACGVDPNPPYVNSVVLTKEAEGLAPGGKVREGDTIRYQFTADNTAGTADVTDYRIIDSIPAGTQLAPNPQLPEWQTLTGTGAAGSIVQTATPFTVKAGEKVTRTLTVQVVKGAMADLVIDNVATFEGSKTPIAQCVANPSLRDCIEDKTLPVVDDSAITLTKTNNIGTPAEVIAGQPFSYTITATNSGNSTADQVQVTDRLPDGIVFAGAQDTTVWKAPNGQSIQSLPFSLAGHTSRTLTLLVKVDPEAAVGSKPANVVALDGTSTPDQCLADTARAGCAFDDNTPTIVDHSNVTIEKKNNLPAPAAGTQPRVQVGDTFSYTITATNTAGSIARDVKLIDQLPAGLGLDPSATQDERWDLTNSGRTLTYLTDIPAGGFVTLPVYVVVLPSATGSLRNAATIDTTTVPDCTATPAPAGCDSKPPYVDTVVSSKASSIANDARVKPGQSIDYTFTADNTAGKDDVANYGFIDRVPAGLVFDTSTADAQGWQVVSGTGQAGTVVRSNPLFVVPAGKTITKTLTMTVDSNAKNGVVIRNVGTIVNGDTPIDQCVANPTKDDCIEEPTDHPVDDSVITLVKTNDVTQSHKMVSSGEPITYTIKATNSGGSEAKGVTLTDQLPEGVEFAGKQDANFWQEPSDARTIQTQPLDIKGGQTITLTLTVKVAEGANGTLTNAAAVDGIVTPDQCVANPLLAGCGVDTGPLHVDNSAISATKTASVGQSAPLKPGQSFSYTIVAHNSGSQDADGVSVSDKIPTGLNWVASADFPDAPVAGVVSSAPFELKAGASKTLTLNVQVDPNTAAGTVIGNIGAIAKPTDDGPTIADCVKDPTGPQCFEEPGTHTVDDSNITIAKSSSLTGNPPLVTAGDTFTYSLLVTNTGNTTDDHVVVTDRLPDGLTFYPADQNGWTLSADGKTATYDAFSLGGKKAKTLSLGVKVDDGLSTGTELKNVSAVAGSTSGGTPVDECVADPTKPGCGPDTNPPEVVDHSQVELTKVNNLTDPVVVPGQTYTYTITARNTGELPVAKVLVSDTLPAGLAFAGNQPGWTITDDTASFRVDLEAGESVSKTLSVTVLQGASGTIYNVAVLDGAKPDPDACKAANPPSRCDSKPPTVDNTDVTIVKSSSLDANARVKPGQRFSYTLTATNAGTEQATGVAFTDTLPAGLNYVPAADDGWTLSADKRTVTSAPFNLPPNGGSKELTITVEVAGSIQPGAVIANTGCTTGLHVDTCATDPKPPTFDDSDIRLTKTNDTAKWGRTVQAGDVFSYTITATNTGHTKADGVTVSDSLPVGLAFDPAEQTGWASLKDRDATSIPLSIPGGQSVKLTLRVRVLDGVKAGAVLANVVAVDGEVTPDECAKNPTLPGCGQDPEPPTVVDHSEVTITKANDVRDTTLPGGTTARIVKPGDTFQYTLTAENTGANLARNVQISDTLPAGLSFAGTQDGWTTDGATARRTIAALQPGEKQSFALNVTVTAGFSGSIKNVAVIDDLDPQDCLAKPDLPGCGVDPKPLDSSNVKVTKSNSLKGAGTVKPGETFSYTITATNAGQGTASNVQVVDLIPAGIEADPSTQPNWTIEGQRATSVSFALAAGQTRTFTLQVKVATDAAAGAAIENAAAVAGIVDPATCLKDPTLAGCGVDPKPPVVDRDVMQIEKHNDLPADTLVVNRGREFGYDITVRNLGYEDATGVAVHDRLPAGLTWSQATQAGWSSIAGQDAVSEPFALAAGASKTLHVRVVATKSSSSLLRNVVALTQFTLPGQAVVASGVAGGTSVSAPTGVAKTIAQCVNDPAQAGCAYDDIVGNSERSGVLIAKANNVTSQIVTRGQSFSYTITVTNTTHAASNGITVTDELPDGLAFASEEPGWQVEGRSATSDPFDLAAGATKTFTLQVTVTKDATGAIRNVAVLDDRNPDDCLAHTDLVGCGLDPRPPFVDEGAAELTVEKVGAVTDVNRNGAVDAGDHVDYSFTVTNTGDAASVSGLAIDDPLLQAAGISVVCPTSEIPAGSSVTCRASSPYVVTAADAASGHLRNVAVASAGGSNSRPASYEVATSGSGSPLPGTGSSGGSLAHTGATVLGVWMASVILIGAGLLALIAARRRRERREP